MSADVAGLSLIWFFFCEAVNADPANGLLIEEARMRSSQTLEDYLISLPSLCEEDSEP